MQGFFGSLQSQLSDIWRFASFLGLLAPRYNYIRRFAEFWDIFRQEWPISPRIVTGYRSSGGPVTWCGREKRVKSREKLRVARGDMALFPRMRRGGGPGWVGSRDYIFSTHSGDDRCKWGQFLPILVGNLRPIYGFRASITCLSPRLWGFQNGLV